MAYGKRVCLNELSLIVVGGQESDKTSVVRTLSGQGDPQHDRRTVNCIKHEGQLRNRRLTVVDTPGWWKDYPLIDTSERTKCELVLSVRLCPPGPHAFILTVEFSKFTEKNQRAVKEHLGLFGEKVWEHTIVVFTRGESLKGKSIEQHIESDGEALKWLLEKCGNRYWVYDKQDTDQSQVSLLLEKIEGVVESNSGRHFELDEKTLKEAEEKKRVAQEGASARRLEVEKKRKQLIKEGKIQPLSEIRIVMLGWVSCGKSSAKNVILNKEKCTSQSRTEKCEKDSALVGERHVTVVDTPGWWKFFSAQYTSGQVKMELEQSVSLGSKSPHALLLVVPADVSFLEEQRKITQENMKMFGEMAWRHTLVLFTWGDTLGNTSIEEHIESEGEPLQWLVEKCGNRYHVFDNVNRGDGSQVSRLLEKIEEIEASANSCDLTHEVQKPKVTESNEQVEEVRSEIVELLDKEWNRRDKELEEKIRTVWKETFEKTMRGNKSNDRFISFHEDEVSLDTSVGTSLQANLPQTECTAKESEGRQLHHGDPEPYQQSDEGHMREAFEREWARFKTIIMDQIRGSIFPELCASYEIPGQAEHELYEQASDRKMREMVEREWARREAVIMEKVEAILSELLSQSEVFSSEPDEHEIEQSKRKVSIWKTEISGIGSEGQDEDTN